MLHAKMCYPTEKAKNRPWSYLLCTVILAALYITMYWLHPILIDDAAIALGMRDLMDNPSASDFLQAYRFHIANWCLYDTGRISNWLVPALLLWPQWVTGVTLGLAGALMTAVGAKVAGAWRRSFFAFGFMGFCFAFALPWGENMFTRCYSANYIFSSIIASLTLYFLIKEKYNIVTALIAGLITGCWHEGFASAVLAGVVAVALFFKQFRKPATLVYALGIVAGVAYLALVPGTRARVSFLVKITNLINLNGGIVLGLPLYASACLYLCALKWRKLLDTLWQPLPVALFGAACGGWIVWRVFAMQGYRTAWPMLLFSILFLTYAVAHTPFFNKKTFTVLGTVMWLTVFTQLSLTLPWFYRLHKENEHLAPAWRWDGAAVFAPYTSQFDAPLYTLNIPSFNINAKHACVGDWTRHVAIIPVELRDFRPEGCEKVESNHTIYRCGNNFVIAGLEIGDRQTVRNATVAFGDKLRYTDVTLVPFTASDQRRYVWCNMSGLFFDAHLHPITAITLRPPSRED